MSSHYIVVPAAEAELVRIGLGMLYAQRKGLPYPMPPASAPTLYVWDPRLSASGLQVAFGPLDSLGGEDADFGEWCLGRELVTSLGILTLPATSEELNASWFPTPPPPEEV